jgi:hypothetical protein
MESATIPYALRAIGGGGLAIGYNTLCPPGKDYEIVYRGAVQVL